MKSDFKLRRDVERELGFSLKIEAGAIAVVTKKGGVSLIGQVSRYRDKWLAERIAKKVCGVSGVTNEIQVVLKGGLQIDVLQQLLWAALAWNGDPADTHQAVRANAVAAPGARRRFN